MPEKIDRDQLLHIANNQKSDQACPECDSLSCPGWISVPGYVDLGKFNIVGTLKTEEAEECWDEYHPDGTNLWSEDAPIAISYHPYSRSDVLQCTHCKRAFLHYTEYGGYYLDKRIRELNLNLVV